MVPTNRQEKTAFVALGVMSGTSLDGLDLCITELTIKEEQWDYRFIKTQTIEYDSRLKAELNAAMRMSGANLMQLDASYGTWIGQKVKDFVKDIEIKIDVIGSHGHTIFHNPANGYSTQIGSGAHIAAIVGIPCVCNFRMGDVARGGQGAPLVPIGDKLLFSEYDYCLNLGGIANISCQDNGKRVAFDICPVNIALNLLANEANEPFDHLGLMGREGDINKTLLKQLNDLPYYKIKGAKSLGREWFNGKFHELISNNSINLVDRLRTTYEHIAIQIATAIPKSSEQLVFVTGGGAWNDFLIELLRKRVSSRIIVPDSNTINFKESLIFALLAVLYLTKTPSCLSSSTGALINSVGGALYY